MSSTEAERELARRTHILARLIERNRAINRTKPTPSGIEPATSISRNAVQLWVKEEEEDLNHVENLRREVRRIAKNGRGSPTGKKPAETDKTSYGSDRRVVLSTKNGVKQNERESESPRLGTTKMEVPAGVPEVNLAAIAVALKVRVKAADMPPLLQEQAFRCARECLDGMARLNSKAVAHALKKEFDTSYGPAWHCIVGTSFGSFVTHSLGGFLYFSMDKVEIIVISHWKIGKPLTIKVPSINEVRQAIAKWCCENTA